jgi:hypothetical protein
LAIRGIGEKEIRKNIYQEAKEAVGDSLTNMTIARVSGFGSFGNYVFGRMPQAQFSSAFLLPMFDSKGVDDTSPISISAVGLDFQVAEKIKKPISIATEFAIYVRVAPTWEEISNKNLNLFPKFTLMTTLRDMINQEISLIVSEKKKGLPETKEDDTREIKRKRNAEIRQFRKAAMIEVYKKYTLEKLLDSKADEKEQDDEVQKQNSIDTENVINDANDTRGPDVISRDQVILSIPNADQKFDAEEIPLKWKRISFKTESLSYIPGENSNSDFETHNLKVKKDIMATVAAWLQSSEGQQQAWRPILIKPSDVKSLDTWNSFLQTLAGTPPDIDRLVPDFEVKLVLSEAIDYLDASKRSIRISLENRSMGVSSRRRNQLCPTIFQTSMSLEMPKELHVPLNLDRVSPSYRYRQYMKYPALGFNCGVDYHESNDKVRIRTTWAPKFVQPRIVPAEREIPTKFSELSADTFEIHKLDRVIEDFNIYIKNLRSKKEEILKGIDASDLESENHRFEADMVALTTEVKLLEKGIQILKESKSAWDDKSKSNRERLGIPWRAWQLMNLSFYRRDKKDADRGWRLFQMGYIISQIPGFASRLTEYEQYFDDGIDEDSASLLYFPTGGGKSEAFYGSLLFSMFLDRLRGKDRGVTGLVRYPLRLLTLQQAQRLLKLVVYAELVRSEYKIGKWPFEIGFWVGSNNTPNSVAGFARRTIPELGEFDDDKTLESICEQESEEVNGIKLKDAQSYIDQRLAYNKVPTCPCCGNKTGLRKVNFNDGSTAVSISCFNKDCEWNLKNDHQPLPFLLTDDLIYMRAPAVIVGTVDKLALIGQHFSTATNVLGMFGLAKWISPSGHFKSPRKRDLLEAGPDASGFKGVVPAYKSGETVFFDPFPSIIIQDEAHLLDESLGTFSGLFQTALENIFLSIYSWAANDLKISKNPARPARPRMPKIIAATATVSGPERQLNVLYQRRPFQFPSPGEDLYNSFYAVPAKAPQENEIRAKSTQWGPEQTAPWMRLFISIMTNGGSHTTTTVSILSAFHLNITELWNLLNSDREELQLKATNQLLDFVSEWNHGEWRKDALIKLRDQKRYDLILGLVDLHRVSLTYVTNKKGGDQVIDALDGVVRREHERAGYALQDFKGKLISGGVGISEIQEVMEATSKVTSENEMFGEIESEIRNIVATSAISHGVDVERFNSMFFAGLPSNIAEYIQASSRVGRTHVGAVILIPTPQSRKDRFVVETHDVFHRFLERMLAPPAVERWGEKAVNRVLSSYFIVWAITNEAEQFSKAPNKAQAKLYHSGSVLFDMANRDKIAFTQQLTEFALNASGFYGGKDGLGKPSHKDFYRTRIDGIYTNFVRNICESRTTIGEVDVEFWKNNATKDLKAPMTSLRDVDEAGRIVASYFDYKNPYLNKDITNAEFLQVMKTIRGQKMRVSETDQEQESGVPNDK